MQDQKDINTKNKLALQRRFEHVSPVLFSEYLYGRGVKSVKCPMCGSEDIGVPNGSVLSVGSDGSENLTYIIPVKLDSDAPPFSLMNYEYRLICKNCSFSMHFAVWPVLKWVEEKLSSGEHGSNG